MRARLRCWTASLSTYEYLQVGTRGRGGAFLCLTLDRNTSISHELGVSAAAGNDVSNMVTQQVASSHCPLQVDAMVWRWVGWGGGVDQISL